MGLTVFCSASAFYRLSCVTFAPYLPRIMIRSGTLCFGWIGTPTVLSSLDCWRWFPRSVGNLVAVEERRLEKGQVLCIWSTFWSGCVDGVVADRCFFPLAGGFPCFQRKKKKQCMWKQSRFGLRRPSFSWVTEVLTFCIQALIF